MSNKIYLVVCVLLMGRIDRQLALHVSTLVPLGFTSGILKVFLFVVNFLVKLTDAIVVLVPVQEPRELALDNAKGGLFVTRARLGLD